MIKIEIPSDSRIEEVQEWDVWEKEPTAFEHFYEKNESFYFLQGEAEITDQHGRLHCIKKGDFVTIDKGADTTWVVKEKVKKHFMFF